MVDQTKAVAGKAWKAILHRPVQFAMALLIVAGGIASGLVASAQSDSTSCSGLGYSGSGTVDCNEVTSTPNGTPGASGPASFLVYGNGGTARVFVYTTTPAGTPPPAGTTGVYFDVSTSGSVTKITMQVCGLSGGSDLEWWNGTEWLPVSGDPGPTLSNGCLSLTLDSSSSPSISDLGGTPFASVQSGYRLVASDGGVFDFGDATFHGSMGGTKLNAPVVGTASDPATGGYWEVASDGGIFAFNAPFDGSMGGKHLNQPIVGMAATPDGGGYWLVAKDGGIFAFGNATFSGSMGGKPLNAPIVGMASDPATGGYWEVASDGGIFAFNAPFDGSMGGLHLNQPIVGVAAT